MANRNNYKDVLEDSNIMISVLPIHTHIRLGSEV